MFDGSVFTRRGVVRTGAGLAVAVPAIRHARAQGATLRMRVYSDINSLDPAHVVTGETDGVIAYALYPRLISYTPGESWTWYLDAAEAIEQTDPLHVSFRLKPGIRWSNGFGDLTTDDVKFSFERIADPVTQSEYRGDWAALDHVEVIDALSGVIVLKEPFAPLFTTTLPWIAGCIVSRKAVEGVGGAFSTEPPAVAGPYALGSWTPKQKIVLARNPDYFGTAPAYDTIEMLPISDDKAAEIAFQAGEIDYTLVSTSSIPVLKANPIADSTLIVRPSETYYWIGMNTAHPLFEDIRIRQAVQYAIDVDEILEAAFFGVTPRATGIIAEGLIGHRPANLIAGPDLDKARGLLAEAGVPDGFKCTLSVLSQTDRITACQIIQAQLARIGIEVEILTYDSGAYWSLGVEADGEFWKDLQLMFLRYTSAPDPFWATQWFVCDQVGVYNWERVCNKEFDELNAEAAREVDSAKRQAMYETMQNLMEQSGAYVFVTYEATAAISRSSIVPAATPNNRALLADFKPA
ncbi:MAG: peptide ABC transporter substrate-binding protein [Alphaproteobacteria bacterium]|nr:peptide ABC transporter substrate-binding protein [Alphaproteobacteria bacterium]